VYPIQIHLIEEEDQSYYFAYHPDFGSSACSATGDTIMEAIESLDNVREDLVAYLKEAGKPIPAPSKLPE